MHYSLIITRTAHMGTYIIKVQPAVVSRPIALEMDGMRLVRFERAMGE